MKKTVNFSYTQGTFKTSFVDSISQVNSNNTAIFRILSDKPMSIKVIHDFRYFETFVEPGDSLFMDFDAETYPTDIVFSGKGALHNKILHQYREAFVQIFSKLVTQKINISSSIEFRKFMDTELSKRWDYYSNLVTQLGNGSSKQFVNFLQAEINYWYAYNLMRYRDEHASVVASENIYLPDAYYDFLNEVIINDDDAFIHPNYTNFLKLYYPFRMSHPDFPHGLASRQHILNAKEPNTPMYLNMDCATEITKIDNKQKLLVLDKYSFNNTTKPTSVAYRVKVRTQDGRVGWMKAHQVEMQKSSTLVNDKMLYVNNLEIEYVKDYLDCITKFDSLGVMADPNESRRLMFVKKDERLDILNEMTNGNVSYNNAGDYYASPFSKVRTPHGLIGWIATAGVQLHFKQKNVSEWQSQIASISQTPFWGLDYFFYGKALEYVVGLELREKLLFNGKKIVDKNYQNYLKKVKTPEFKAEIENIFAHEDKKYTLDTAFLKKAEIIIDQRSTSLNKRTIPFELAIEDTYSHFPNTSQLAGGNAIQENTIAALEKGIGIVTTSNTIPSAAAAVVDKNKAASIPNNKKKGKVEIFKEPIFPEVKYEFRPVTFKGNKSLINKYQLQIAIFPDLVNKTEKNPSYIVKDGKKMWIQDTFLYTINLSEPVNGYIKTKNDSFAIWLEPGQRYEVTEEAGKLKINGEGSNAFEYHKKIQILNAKIEEETQKAYELTTADFKAFMLKKLKEKKDFLIDNNVVKKLPVSYYKMVDFDNEYWYYNHLLDYPSKHKNMDLAGYFGFIRDIKIQNDRALNSLEYRRFVYKFLEKQVAINEKLGLPVTEIARFTYSTRVLKFWQANYLAEKGKQTGMNTEFLDEIQKYADDSSFPTLNDALKTSYYKETIKKGGYKAPVFQYVNAQNQTVKSADFKGKVVLVHLWSANHKDYKKEMDALDDLQKKLNNPSIVIVKVNTDKNSADWVKAVKKYKKDKYQVYGNDYNTYTQNLSGFFDLNPTNATKIIIDKKGNFSQIIKSQFTESELLINLRNEFSKR